MREADILAATYEDTCTVHRAYKTELDSGETVFKQGSEGKVIYENIPCALSNQSGGKLNQTPATAKIPTEYCLFTRPEVDVEPNDYLVINHLGKEIIASAGFPERTRSHNNIPLKMDREDA